MDDPQQGGALRCEITRNECGTDTWGEGYTCPCYACRKWLAQQGDALEAAARELAENLTLYGATEQDVADALAIMRRHGLRAPAPDPDRAALVEQARSYGRILLQDGGSTEVAHLLYELASALAAPAEREPDAPTPESLRALAEWFDNPNESPAIAVQVARVRLVTPGYLLRLIAEGMERCAPPAPERQEGQDG